MSTDRDEVLQQALALPPADRLFVAAALEDSLPDEILPSDGVCGDEFLKELQRRSASYRGGTATVHSAEDVLAELHRSQADEKST